MYLTQLALLSQQYCCIHNVRTRVCGRACLCALMDLLFFVVLYFFLLHSDTGGAGHGPSKQTTRDRGHPVSVARGRVGGRGNIKEEEQEEDDYSYSTIL